MALIEVFHVVAGQYQLNPDDTPDTAFDIPQGSVIGLDANGFCVLANDNNTITPLAVAGDSRSWGTTSYTPESGSALSRDPTTTMTGALVTGGWGRGQRFTQNRVPDNYDETLASQKMTAYVHGVFWTDQYETIDISGNVCAFTPGDPLYASPQQGAQVGAGGVVDVASNGGKFTCTDDGGTRSRVVAYVLTDETDYPSGVPGTTTAMLALPEGGNSLSWGTFIQVQLV